MYKVFSVFTLAYLLSSTAAVADKSDRWADSFQQVQRQTFLQPKPPVPYEELYSNSLRPWNAFFVTTQARHEVSRLSSRISKNYQYEDFKNALGLASICFGLLIVIISTTLGKLPQ